MNSKFIYAFAILMLCTIISIAQTFSKMNLELARKAQSLNNQNNKVSLLIQGDMTKIKHKLADIGGQFNYSAGNIASVTIPARSIASLAIEKYVNKMEYKRPQNKLLSDSMRIRAHVNQVHAGLAPLTQGYDGTGVVMGIIDTGIDFNNPDFKDSITGKTRVKFLWDQNAKKSSNTPVPYGYGEAWTNVQIDAGICTETDYSPGHGTCTCGIAAGNGKASPGHKYMGVAPNSDLVVVAMNFDSVNAIPDAADYIFRMADSLGEPCVINISVGGYAGSHDGQDLQALLLDSMILAKNGRAIVAAAGNEGSTYTHLTGNLSPSDTNFTWFRFNTSNYIIEFWADTLNFKKGLFAIGADKASKEYLFRGRTPFIGIKDNLGIIRKDSIMNSSGKRIALVESNTSIQGGTYDISYSIIPDSSAAAYNWRLMFTGQGTFDLWDDYSVTTDTSLGMRFNGLPSKASFPAIANYQMPDTLETVCSSFQCSDNVITVSMYLNKQRYTDIKGDVVHFIYLHPDHIWAGSSMGPTRDGRIKPDITAPGSVTITTGVLSLMAQWALSSPSDSLVEQSNYVRSSGTSAASPVVAGVAALYLQKNPTATAAEIKKAILICPITDSYTGPVPNYTWGYGKVNAFSALAGCSTGIENYSKNEITLNIYPNPFTELTTIEYDLSPLNTFSAASIQLHDLIGKLVRTENISEKISRITLQKGSLEAGSYIYNLVIDGKVLKSGRLVIL